MYKISRFHYAFHAFASVDFEYFRLENGPEGVSILESYNE